MIYFVKITYRFNIKTYKNTKFYKNKSIFLTFCFAVHDYHLSD